MNKRAENRLLELPGFYPAAKKTVICFCFLCELVLWVNYPTLIHKSKTCKNLWPKFVFTLELRNIPMGGSCNGIRENHERDSNFEYIPSEHWSKLGYVLDQFHLMNESKAVGWICNWNHQRLVLKVYIHFSDYFWNRYG